MALEVGRRYFSQVLEGFQGRGYAVGGSGPSGLRVNLGWRAEFCHTLRLRVIPFGSPEVLAWASDSFQGYIVTGQATARSILK